MLRVFLLFQFRSRYTSVHSFFIWAFVGTVKQLANVCLVILEYIVHQWGDDGQADTRVDSAFDLLVKLVSL